MKKIYKSFIFIVMSFLLGSACTDRFEDINTRTDRLTSADPDFQFGLTTVNTLRDLTGRPTWNLFVNHANQMNVIGGGGPTFNREEGGTWNGLYTRSLTPLTKIIDDYGTNEGYANRVAIARIWRAYVFSHLVSLYGPLPYTEACKGIPQTKFNTEDEIYRDILKELKDAYTVLEDINSEIIQEDRYPVTADPFIQEGDTKIYLQRWSQFAHCIRLKVALQLSNMIPDNGMPSVNYNNSTLFGRPDMKPIAAALQVHAREILAEELDNSEDNLLIGSNAENFFMQFQQSPIENQNPLYRDMEAIVDKGDGGNFPVIHESMVMWMYPYNDPTWRIYVQNGDGVGTGGRMIPTNMGRAHGGAQTPPDFGPLQIQYPANGFDKWENWARVGRVFTRADSKFYFYTYAELAFTKAEARYLNIWQGPKSAEEYYNEGITARCERDNNSGIAGVPNVTAANITNYINRPGIKWSTPVDAYIEELIADEDFDARLEKFQDWNRLTNSFLFGPEDDYKRIIVQHWLALFVRTFDSYTLLRRTGVLEFKPRWSTNATSGYCFSSTMYGDETVWAYTPQRFPYPNNEFNLNSEAKLAVNNLLWDNKLQDIPEDQITYRLIFTKDSPQIGVDKNGANKPVVIVGTQTQNPPTREYVFRNLARNF